MGQKVEVFSDFDGTATTADTLQLLLETFAGEAWHAIEREVEAGLIPERESLQREFDLVRATRAEAMRVIGAGVGLSEGFPGVVSMLGERGTPFVLLSGGFEEIIRSVLARHEFERLEVRANRVRIRGRSWKVVPSGRPSLCGRCNHCKSHSIEEARARGATTVFIGNGHTDRCPASRADIVFAKDALSRYCEGAAVPHRPFADFNDVRRALARLLV